MTDRQLDSVVLDRIPDWLADELSSKALATIVDEVLITADATLDDETAPPGRLIRVHEASEARVTLTIPNDRPTGWRRTIQLTSGEIELALGNNALTVDGVLFDSNDTAIVTGISRLTLWATAPGELVRIL